MRIALVSCAKRKRDIGSPARDLYVSPLFRAQRRYAERVADQWYILSAKHGLLKPTQVIYPYDITLNQMTPDERRAWAKRVSRQLIKIVPRGARVIILAGRRYRDAVEPFLRACGTSVSVPLEGLAIGKQLRKLKQLTGQRQDSSKSASRQTRGRRHQVD